MTDSEWEECASEERMLEVLRGKEVSRRRASLFLCAVCRMNWHLLYDPASQECVEIVERFVDGQASDEELRYSRYCAECSTFGYDFAPARWRGQTKLPVGVQKLLQMGVISEQDFEREEAAVEPQVKQQFLAAANLAYNAGSTRPLEDSCLLTNLRRIDGPVAAIARCIFGPPGKEPIEARWVSPNVQTLAQTVYTGCDYDKLPVLADALEDAGCQKSNILKHCRESIRHFRGCWVVDLLLAKH
jgi:hypothetical protein